MSKRGQYERQSFESEQEQQLFTLYIPEDDKDKDKEMLWIIIGASVGGAIVLIIVVAVVAWCVHHKRKCRRKGSKGG